MCNRFTGKKISFPYTGAAAITSGRFRASVAGTCPATAATLSCHRTTEYGMIILGYTSRRQLLLIFTRTERDRPGGRSFFACYFTDAIKRTLRFFYFEYTRSGGADNACNGRPAGHTHGTAASSRVVLYRVCFVIACATVSPTIVVVEVVRKSHGGARPESLPLPEWPRQPPTVSSIPFRSRRGRRPWAARHGGGGVGRAKKPVTFGTENMISSST